MISYILIFEWCTNVIRDWYHVAVLLLLISDHINAYNTHMAKYV